MLRASFDPPCATRPNYLPRHAPPECDLSYHRNSITGFHRRHQRRMEYQRITVDWDHDRLKRDRLAKLQAQMQERDIGGMYLTEGCHTRYLLDAQVPVGKVFVPVEGE